MSKEKTRDPLFHIAKREPMPVWKRLLIYAGAIVGALLLTSIFCTLSSTEVDNPFMMFVSMIDGAFGGKKVFEFFMRDFIFLLGVSYSLLPAFKMKFWNLGANGQIIIGGLVAYAFMRWGSQSGAAVPLVWAFMVIFGVLASVVWAAIPAIFKALFKTNETLFTLMMNYIAQGLVAVMIADWTNGSQTTIGVIDSYAFPELFASYVIPAIAIAAVAVFMIISMTKGKHGYEIAVVGDSENTAKYAGMNVKLITIRTLILSGLICGIVGVLLTGCIHHSITDDMHSNMGFTAIMTSWLASFNPIVIIGTCFLITFISKGMLQVKTDFGFTNNAIADVAIGVIYFCIIACQFFINYKLVFRKKETKQTEKTPSANSPAAPAEKTIEKEVESK